MTDGYFTDVEGQFFGELYTTNLDYSRTLIISTDGNIYARNSGYIMCEKSLIKDSIMCLDKSNLQSNVAMNTSSAISILSHNSAAVCIEYCRGWSNQSYAVLNSNVCTCGSSLLFDPQITESANGTKKPLRFCPYSPAFSKIGSDSGNGNKKNFTCV
jgi:hypothetical protein